MAVVVKVVGGYLEVEGGGMGGGGSPPGIWGPTDPRPTPPIYMPPGAGGQPPGIWPSPGHPAHPIAPGGVPGAHPEHPIYYPPGIWGPTDPRPTPPIFIPPSGGHPGQPPGIWGPPGPWPTPPIYIPSPPPEYPSPPADGAEKPPPEDGGWGYDDKYGWFLTPPAGTPSPKA